MLDRITPLILTRDEEPNIERTLRQLTWAHEVLVVDSFSTDATVDIARRLPNVRVLQRAFDTHAQQWNYGLAQVRTSWVLALDADHIVTDAAVRELAALAPPRDTHAYIAPFVYAVRGKRLRASLYPPRIVLFEREHGTFWQDGHTQRIRTDGVVATLQSPFIHDDRKSFRRFIQRQRGYMRAEAAKLRAQPARTLPERIRKLIVVAPFAVLVHTLFVKRLILDGWPGLVYAFERFVAEVMLSRELLSSRKTR